MFLSEDTGFEAALRDARHLLHDLPRTRDAVVEARERVNRWRAGHPGVRAELVADQPPGSLFVDYDLLLDDPTGGTFGLDLAAGRRRAVARQLR